MVFYTLLDRNSLFGSRLKMAFSSSESFGLSACQIFPLNVWLKPMKCFGSTLYFSKTA